MAVEFRHKPAVGNLNIANKSPATFLKYLLELHGVLERDVADAISWNKINTHIYTNIVNQIET